MESKPDGLPNLAELIWVEDLRSKQRFIVRLPLRGELDGEDAEVLDLSTGGFRIAHRMHVRIGESAKLRVHSEDGDLPFRAKVMWSRLSHDRDPDDSLLYTSGMRIEDVPKRIGDPVERLVRTHCRPDTTSMETKRAMALERLLERITVERELLVDVDPTELLEGYRALGEVARLDPDEKDELVRDAKEALARESSPAAWNRNVLAAWKSIDGRVELKTIEAARRILSEVDHFVDEHD